MIDISVDMAASIENQIITEQAVSRWIRRCRDLFESGDKKCQKKDIPRRDY